MTVDEKMVLKNKVEKKHHVEVKQVQEQPGKKIVLQVEGAQRQVVAEIKNSLIVEDPRCAMYIWMMRRCHGSILP